MLVGIDAKDSYYQNVEERDGLHQQHVTAHVLHWRGITESAFLIRKRWPGDRTSIGYLQCRLRAYNLNFAACNSWISAVHSSTLVVELGTCLKTLCQYAKRVSWNQNC